MGRTIHWRLGCNNVIGKILTQYNYTETSKLTLIVEHWLTHGHSHTLTGGKLQAVELVAANLVLTCVKVGLARTLGKVLPQNTAGLARSSVHLRPPLKAISLP